MPFRIELAKTARSGCTNTECKTKGEKIAKGELRYCSLVTIKEHDSWKYKHWGCVTPLQIETYLESIGGKEAFEHDPGIVDGWDELDPEGQDKVIRALEDGHVADEDWRGDVEKNRIGQRGFRLTAKEKAAKELADEGEEADELEIPSKPKAIRGRKPKKNADNDGDEDHDRSPAPTKKRAAPRKRKTGVEEDHPQDGGQVPAKKTAGPKKRKAAAERDEADDLSGPEPVPEAEPAKKPRTKKAKVADTVPEPAEEESGGFDGASDMKKPAEKRGRAKKAAKDAEKEVDLDQGAEVEDQYAEVDVKAQPKSKADRRRTTRRA